MFPMFDRFFSIRRFVAAGVMVAALGTVVQAQQDTTKRGRKYKAPPATAHVEIIVTRATTGKPVDNASVIFHPMEDGKSDGNMELKTNDEGKTLIDLLEVGSTVRMQIIAPGFQTYGEDFKIDKDAMAIHIKLKRPQEQYSIYKKSEGNAPDKNKPEPKADEAKPDAQKADAPKTDTSKDADAQKDAGSDAKPKAPPADGGPTSNF